MESFSIFTYIAIIFYFSRIGFENEKTKEIEFNIFENSIKSLRNLIFSIEINEKPTFFNILYLKFDYVFFGKFPSMQKMEKHHQVCKKFSENVGTRGDAYFNMLKNFLIFQNVQNQKDVLLEKLENKLNIQKTIKNEKRNEKKKMKEYFHLKNQIFHLNENVLIVDSYSASIAKIAEIYWDGENLKVKVHFYENFYVKNYFFGMELQEQQEVYEVKLESIIKKVYVEKRNDFLFFSALSAGCKYVKLFRTTRKSTRQSNLRTKFGDDQFSNFFEFLQQKDFEI